jgi:DNA-binding beta-propeller fold protein YncE
MGTMLTVRLPFGLVAPRSRRVFLCAVVALLSLVSCASASAALNLTGTWSANYHCESGTCAGGDFPATDTLTQAEGSPTVTGSNVGETITGTLTGNTFVFESSVGAYTAKATLTVAANGLSWSGPLEDSNGTTGTYTARRDPPPSGSLAQLPSPANCVSVQGAGGNLGCGTLIPSALSHIRDLAISPDGRNVYAAGQPAGGALIEFSRNQATGALSEIGCVTGGAAVCAPENDTSGATAMNEPEIVKVSPNGANVYVTTTQANALVTFSRNPETGLLTETGCISHNTSTGCAITEARGLDGPGEITVSPDEKNVYVTSYFESAVAEFARDTITGELSPLLSPNECISSDAASKCGTVTAAGLEQASSLAVSSDGANVYVAAVGESGGDVAELERNPAEGALKQLGSPNACLSTEVVACTHVIDMYGPGEIVVSPDGRNVYANSFDFNAVLEFERNTSGPEVGALKQLEAPNTCISSEAKTPEHCTSAKSIQGPFGMAISPDGSNLYATGSSSDAIATFTRNPSTGGLTQFAEPYECITEAASGCHTNKAVGLKAAFLPVVSPDGANVYVGGEESSIAEFARSRRLGGLNIAGYCESLGDDGTGSGSTTLLRGAVEGPEYAYENWACVQDTGTTVPIAVTGPAPSMNDACAHEFPGTSSYGYPENPNSAYTWNCYTLLPIGEEKEEEKKAGGGGGGGSSGGPSAKVASLLTPIVSVGPLIVPPPVLVKTGNVAPVSGTVLVKLPGTSKFVPLSSLRQVPFGSIIEATHGTVSVTTAEPGGTTQTGEFFEGEFILRQGPNGLVIAELTGGDFSVCPTKRERAHIAGAENPFAQSAAASGSHVVRKLWANAHGKFSTKGNYAAGAVQGTEWLTEDLCDGTLIKVTRDKVAVTNLVNRKHVEVTTGHHYLAKAP